MVATQGRYDYDQWVKSFKVAYSKYGSHFEFQDKVNTDIIKYTTARVLNHFDLGKGLERICFFKYNSFSDLFVWGYLLS